MKTTLNKIRVNRPCNNGWEKLLKHLGKTKADDEQLPITTIIDSNGLDDALWCLRAVEGYDREIRLYAIWCVRQVQHLLKDPRSIVALDVAEKYANGQATKQELDAAYALAVAARTAAAAVDAAARAAAAATFAAAAGVAAAADAARTAAAYAARADADALDAARANQEKELRKICESIAKKNG